MRSISKTVYFGGLFKEYAFRRCYKKISKLRKKKKDP